MYRDIYLYRYTCICTYLYTCSYVFVYLCMCTCIYTHVSSDPASKQASKQASRQASKQASTASKQASTASKQAQQASKQAQQASATTKHSKPASKQASKQASQQVGTQSQAATVSKHNKQATTPSGHSKQALIIWVGGEVATFGVSHKERFQFDIGCEPICCAGLDGCVRTVSRRPNHIHDLGHFEILSLFSEMCVQYLHTFVYAQNYACIYVYGCMHMDIHIHDGHGMIHNEPYDIVDIVHKYCAEIGLSEFQQDIFFLKYDSLPKDITLGLHETEM